MEKGKFPYFSVFHILVLLSFRIAWVRPLCAQEPWICNQAMHCVLAYWRTAVCTAQLLLGCQRCSLRYKQTSFQRYIEVWCTAVSRQHNVLDNPKSHSLRCKQLSLQTVDFKAKRFSMSASVSGGEVDLYWCKGTGRSRISYSNNCRCKNVGGNYCTHTQLIKVPKLAFYLFTFQKFCQHFQLVFLQLLSICGKV